MRQLEMIVVPGVLQTPEYIRAMIIGVNPGMAHDVVERRVVARIARQRALAHAGGEAEDPLPTARIGDCVGVHQPFHVEVLTPCSRFSIRLSLDAHLVWVGPAGAS